MPLPYNIKLTPRAIELSKDATLWENKLWYRFLNKYPVRFKRQKPICNFIADFYCDNAKLIIELDGSQHNTEDSLVYDETRSRILEHYGLQVLRFTNSDVDMNFDIVCEQIDETVKQRIGNLSRGLPLQPPAGDSSPKGELGSKAGENRYCTGD